MTKNRAHADHGSSKRDYSAMRFFLAANIFPVRSVFMTTRGADFDVVHSRTTNRTRHEQVTRTPTPQVRKSTVSFFVLSGLRIRESSAIVENVKLNIEPWLYYDYYVIILVIKMMIVTKWRMDGNLIYYITKKRKIVFLFINSNFHSNLSSYSSNYHSLIRYYYFTTEFSVMQYSNNDIVIIISFSISLCPRTLGNFDFTFDT